MSDQLSETEEAGVGSENGPAPVFCADGAPREGGPANPDTDELANNRENEIANAVADALYGVFGNEEEGKLGDWEYEPELEEKRALTTEEMFVLSLHIKGESNESISIITGHSIAYVNNVILLPMSQNILKRVDASLEMEIKGMKPLAVSAMREVLQIGDAKAKGAMVDKYFKISGRYEGDNNKARTAEDIISKMMDVIKEQAMTTNNLTHARNLGIDGQFHRVPPPADMQLDYERAIDVEPEED